MDFDSSLTGGVNFLKNLYHAYQGCNLAEKQRLIGLIFPEKLIFENGAYRTKRMNEAVWLLCSGGKGFNSLKKKLALENECQSELVIPLGLEPRAHTLKVYCSTN